VTLLTELVLGMIAIAIGTSALSVVQTYISTEVGQASCTTCACRSIATSSASRSPSFTRTRAGEVQSRIANDIGGIDNVATSTATTIAQNATTVLATTVVLVLLDWRLALISFALLPLFVWLTRRSGASGARSPRASRAGSLTSPRWWRSRSRSPA